MKYHKVIMLLTDDEDPEPLSREDIRDELSLKGTAGIYISQIIIEEVTVEQYQSLCITNGKEN